MSSEDLPAGHESVSEQQEDKQQMEMEETKEESVEESTPPPEEAPKDKFIEPAPPSMTIKEKMMQEEAKLKNKYPNLRVGGGSALLAKRLNQQKVKFFDSGDYNMAMAKKKSSAKPTKPIVLEQETTGEAIPTPDTVPQRKLSLAQSRISTGMLS